MERELSVAAVLARLEAQAAFHRQQEAFHAERETYHREQRAAHGAELAELNRRLQAFRASAAEALELAARPVAAATAEEVSVDLGSASRPKLGSMVALLLESKAAGERFGPSGLAEEVNQRFGERLRRPATAAQVSTVLRRMHRLGKIHQDRRGRSRQEALYAKKASA
jgi:hypothetical protein